MRDDEKDLLLVDNNGMLRMPDGIYSPGSGILLPNDDLPNSGLVTLATIPGACPGDLDPDGDVDGHELAILAHIPTIMALGNFVIDFGKATCE